MGNLQKYVGMLGAGSPAKLIGLFSTFKRSFIPSLVPMPEFSCAILSLDLKITPVTRAKPVENCGE